MSVQKEALKKKTYKLDIIKEWSGGDNNWMYEFIELLLKEIPQKIDIIKDAYKEQNSQKLAYELHQLSSQLCLLDNDEITKLIQDIEKHVIKKFPIKNVLLLIEKSNKMLAELKYDFNNKLLDQLL